MTVQSVPRGERTASSARHDFMDAMCDTRAPGEVAEESRRAGRARGDCQRGGGLRGAEMTRCARRIEEPAREWFEHAAVRFAAHEEVRVRNGDGVIADFQE